MGLSFDDKSFIKIDYEYRFIYSNILGTVLGTCINMI